MTEDKYMEWHGEERRKADRANTWQGDERRIDDRLERIVAAAKQVRDGHLGETVPFESKEGLGQFVEIFNDLSVNLQEVLLFVGAVSNDMSHIVEEIEKHRPENKKHRKLNHQLDLLIEKIEELKEMVRSFDYYHVRFDGEAVLGDEPDEVLEQFKDLTQ